MIRAVAPDLHVNRGLCQSGLSPRLGERWYTFRLGRRRAAYLSPPLNPELFGTNRHKPAGEPV